MKLYDEELYNKWIRWSPQEIVVNLKPNDIYIDTDFTIADLLFLLENNIYVINFDSEEIWLWKEGEI